MHARARTVKERKRRDQNLLVLKTSPSQNWRTAGCIVCSGRKYQATVTCGCPFFALKRRTSESDNQHSASVSVRLAQSTHTHGSSLVQHLNTWATIGRAGSSGFARCNQSANLTFHPLYCSSSTNVLSFVDTRNVVTPDALLSESDAECKGRATPGPARRPAKLVVEAYGGPGGGLGEVMAW